MTIDYKYIEMEQIENPNKKTNIYNIKNKSSDNVIGKIKWFYRWRQYCFYPEPFTIFSKGCLEDIIDFIYRLKKEREELKANGRSNGDGRA